VNGYHSLNRFLKPDGWLRAEFSDEYRATDPNRAFCTRRAPSPGGQISGMVAGDDQPASEVGAPGAIPSTSRRATRPQRGGTPGGCNRRFRRRVPPRCGPVGLCQVDGMAPRIGHQKGIKPANTGPPAAPPPPSALTSPNSTQRHRPALGIRLRDEEVALALWRAGRRDGWVSGPASFVLVQRGGIGLWSALMSTGRATVSLTQHASAPRPTYAAP